MSAETSSVTEQLSPPPSPLIRSSPRSIDLHHTPSPPAPQIPTTGVIKTVSPIPKTTQNSMNNIINSKSPMRASPSPSPPKTSTSISSTSSRSSIPAKSPTPPPIPLITPKSVDKINSETLRSSPQNLSSNNNKNKLNNTNNIIDTPMINNNNINNTNSSQQFCLRWNNYQTNLTNVFDQLLHNESFVDVTLACDGQSIKAHKMVLSACSPYFQALFFDNPCQHPIIIMRDVKWTELKAIVDFMYKGEINVNQDQIGPLLKLAETLKIRGLADVKNDPDGCGDLDDDIITESTATILPSSMAASVATTSNIESLTKKDEYKDRKSARDENKSNHNSKNSMFPPFELPSDISALKKARMSREWELSNFETALAHHHRQQQQEQLRKEQLHKDQLQKDRHLQQQQQQQQQQQLQNRKRVWPNDGDSPLGSLTPTDFSRDCIENRSRNTNIRNSTPDITRNDGIENTVTAAAVAAVAASQQHQQQQQQQQTHQKQHRSASHPSTAGTPNLPTSTGLPANFSLPGQLETMLLPPSISGTSASGIHASGGGSTGSGGLNHLDDLEIKPGIAEMIREEERAKLMENSHAWLGASTSSIADSYQYQLQSMWQKCWNQNQNIMHQNMRFRERGPLKSWRPEAMAEAIFSVLREGLSLSQAARKYDIPYPTFVLYANRVHNMLGPSMDGDGSDSRPKGRGRPQRILLGVWPDDHIKNVVKTIVFRDVKELKDEAASAAMMQLLYGRNSPVFPFQEGALNFPGGLVNGISPPISGGGPMSPE